MFLCLPTHSHEFTSRHGRNSEGCSGTATARRSPRHSRGLCPRSRRCSPRSGRESGLGCVQKCSKGERRNEVHSVASADSRYGCSKHAQRGNAVCKNNLLIRRQDLERQLLAGLEARVLHPDVVAYTLKRFEEELEKALATRSQGDADLRRQTGEIERGIANQLRALRDGYSPAITADLAKLETPAGRRSGAPEDFGSSNRQVANSRHAAFCRIAARRFECIMGR